ncbi:helix-turn-helix domain-containing protein [Fodinibius salsisoli]|uniref:Helix-turn-helix transcriptional regulator n=1 Tax=Fodinibius salsisoli TaxID=2820877 RepID=A0ABT3PIQ8_9BACT|nr:helix-turn-helix transcriptional regulator [Fodinibius salsisoli]MCW9705807.1 helix-turn-helix transcriptional regulator [Fodinibius salsisoli]
MEKQQVQNIFGEVIYEIRMDKNLKQSEVAEKGRMDVTYISDLERGKYMPSLFTVLKLAKGLEVIPTKLISALQEKMNASE